MKAEYIIEEILRREGGYVDQPVDKGGPKNKGITLKTLQCYQPGASLSDLKALTASQAFAIYRALYVDPFYFVADNGIKALLVDMAVNHGKKNAEKMLQRALGMKDDGVIGQITPEALEKAGPDLYYKLLAERIKFYGHIINHDHSQATFAEGWMVRCAEFLAA